MWIKYYDFEKDSSSNGVVFVLLCFCFLLLGIFMFYSGLSDSKENKQNEDIIGKNNSVSQAVGGLIITLFSLFIFILIGISSMSGNSSYEKIKKNIKIVEGCVEDFKAGKGRVEESFKVANINFAYKETHTTWGYNKIRSQGGVIDANKYVRIHYYEGEILRLWVFEETQK